MRLHLTATQHAELLAYLFQTTERVALLFIPATDLGEDAHIAELWLLDEQQYRHANRFGVELAEHVRPELIRIAHQRGYAVVEAHAHGWPGRHTRFSPTDMDGLSALGPHMTWRLTGPTQWGERLAINDECVDRGDLTGGVPLQGVEAVRPEDKCGVGPASPDPPTTCPQRDHDHRPL